jgi:hypothetical protein
MRYFIGFRMSVFLHIINLRLENYHQIQVIDSRQNSSTKLHFHKLIILPNKNMESNDCQPLLTNAIKFMATLVWTVISIFPLICIATLVTLMSFLLSGILSSMDQIQK